MVTRTQLQLQHDLKCEETITIIKKDIDFSVVFILKWRYPSIYEFRHPSVHSSIFSFLHLYDNYVLSGDYLFHCMLENEPGTCNAKINKTKSLISSNLRPQEKKANSKSIIATIHCGKCCPWERLWKEYLHLPDCLGLKMEEVRKTQNVFDVLDGIWIKGDYRWWGTMRAEESKI